MFLIQPKHKKLLTLAFRFRNFLNLFSSSDTQHLFWTFQASVSEFELHMFCFVE